MKSVKIRNKIKFYLVIIILFCDASACKKLVEVSPPVTSISSENVYTSDATSIAAVTGIYSTMSTNSFNYQGFPNCSLLPGLSADELTLYGGATNTLYHQYYTNSLTNLVFGDFWSTIYPVVYLTNSAIEGLNGSTGLTPSIKQQLVGEAKFSRALCYFYLVNYYGDVPLVLSTDYKSNAVASRAPVQQVWQQIISDLKDAQTALSQNYLDASLLNTTTERVRPTYWAASALLARSYLYVQKWDSAAAEATSVINHSTLYNLDSLNGVFLENSTEAIWQLQPVSLGGFNTLDALLFILPQTGPNGGSQPVYLSNSLLGSFENGDLRRVQWVDSVIVSGITYYFAYKYKSATLNAPITEYQMVLRLGEQYLIRAEAESEQGDLSDAENDLNTIRNRAGLPNTTANDQASLLSAILHERQIELFTEWGNRWLDLKRTANVNLVMGTNGACAAKGGTWNANWQWYPIPLSDLQKDPNLSQNLGY